jgi:transcriptional regulator with XRE-family HTH domain
MFSLMEMAVPMQSVANTQDVEFNDYFRSWRRYRKLSQLELALTAGVSQRHVSWLETGRSKPSREMVIRLSEAMEIPLRERNTFLQTAGFANVYTEKALEEPTMSAVFDVIRTILDHHDPMPAVVVDRLWNVRMKNGGADLMFSLAGDSDEVWRSIGDDGEHNLALLTLHPKGLRPFIANWDAAAPEFIRRLKREALASGDPRMREKFAKIIALAGPVAETGDNTSQLMPVLPLEISVNGLNLSLFSVITTFGTPQDITTEELRIEAFYPSDKDTAALFQNLSQAH